MMYLRIGGNCADIFSSTTYQMMLSFPPLIGGMIDRFPPELNQQVMNWLPLSDAVSMARTNRYGHDVFRDPQIQRRLHDWDYVFRNAIDAADNKMLLDNFFRLRLEDQMFLIDYAMSHGHRESLFIMLHDLDDLDIIREYATATGDEALQAYVMTTQDLRDLVANDQRELLIPRLRNLSTLQRLSVVRFAIRSNAPASSVQLYTTHSAFPPRIISNLKAHADVFGSNAVKRYFNHVLRAFRGTVSR